MYVLVLLMDILVLFFILWYHAYVGVVIDICNAFVMEGALEGERLCQPF